MKRAIWAVTGAIIAIAIVAGIPVFTKSLLAPSAPPPARPLEKPAQAANELPPPAVLEVYPAFSRTVPGAPNIAPAPPIAGTVSPPVLAAADALALERRLADLSYLVGAADGVLDSASKHALTAFQKVEGLSRTGQADPATLAKISTAMIPAPAYSTPPRHIEVDIARQVIFVVDNGRVTATLPTATGTGKKFTSQGWTRRAVTPNGAFAIYGKRAGWRRSPLGMLYRPAYFNGGIALHGSKSVPTSPASHGCVRVPMAFADWFADNVAHVGTVVYVYGNASQPNPAPVADAAALMRPPPPPTDVPAPADPGAVAPAPPAEQPLLGLL